LLDWALLGANGAEHLPAVRWREFHFEQAGPDTRDDIVRELEELLGA
jgi:hypothetical protein